jgi:hypothetical protein
LILELQQQVLTQPIAVASWWWCRGR